MNVNTTNPANVSSSSLHSWLLAKLYEGCEGDVSPDIGNGLEITRVRILFYWMSADNSNHLVEYDVDMDASLSEVNGKIHYFALNSGNIPTNAHLMISVWIYGSDPDNELWYGCYDTGLNTYLRPCGQVTANTPSPCLNGYVVNYSGQPNMACSVDLQAESYECEITDINGNVLYSEEKEGTTFYCDVLQFGNPHLKWRARSKNSLGAGSWSDWCYFDVFIAADSPSFSGTVYDHPSKPITVIEVNGSIPSIPIGNTLVDSTFTVIQNGGFSGSQNNGTNQNPTFSTHNGVTQVDADVTLEVNYSHACGLTYNKSTNSIIYYTDGQS